jgi:hypothetical protein
MLFSIQETILMANSLWPVNTNIRQFPSKTGFGTTIDRISPSCTIGIDLPHRTLFDSLQ